MFGLGRVALASLAVVGIWALTGNAGTAGTVALTAPKIQPHRAVYELTLGETKPDSSVVEAQGVLVFEWAAACDGWAVSQKARVDLGHDEGPGLAFGWIYNSWEAKDGGKFRFYVRRLYQSGSSEQVKGEASIADPGVGGVAHFSLPDEMEVDIPSGVIFPTQHTLALLERLEAGGLPYYTTVFDGSTDNGLYGVSAIEVSQDAERGPPPLDSPILANMASWRLNMAFFGMDQAAAEPEQEQELRIFANGITDELTFDYGDFALDATLSELTALPEPDC